MIYICHFTVWKNLETDVLRRDNKVCVNWKKKAIVIRCSYYTSRVFWNRVRIKF